MADPEMDIVLVATPPDSHKALALGALGLGKHVIVEKPGFLEATDFDEVRSAAVRSGRRVLVAENYFYKPLRRLLERILAEEVIGELLLIHVDAVKRQDAPGWRSDPQSAGGGALFEGGIHWISLLAGLGLEVRQASGLLPGRAAGERGPGRERSALVVMEYAGGAVATLSYSWEVPSPLAGLRLSRMYGTRGAVTFESNGVFAFVRGSRMRFHVPGLRDLAGYRAMFVDFIDAIRREREPGMTLDMAERDVRLVRDIYRSMAPGSGSLPGRDA